MTKTPSFFRFGRPCSTPGTSTWRASEIQYKEQQTAVAQTQADVSAKYLLYQATNNAEVKAPLSGIVSNLAISEGSAVAAKTATVNQPVLTIVTNPTVEAVVLLNESDIANVAPGQKATLMVNALNGAVYEGEVSRADSIGTSVGGVIRYMVYITIANPDEALRSGMTADTDIVTNTVPGVLSVPNAAVKPYQGGRAVRVPDKKTGKMTYVPVTIGVKGKERTEIKSGIDETADIILTLSNEQLKRSPGLFGN
jgi:HlyD family secretion protein